jgi:outer membrane protein assembly complex protein YaeT
VSAVLILTAVLVTGGCHEEGDVKVLSLGFTGNQAFSSGQLSRVVVTQAGGKLPWSKKRYFNRAIFDDDVDRLQAFYSDRGYPDARITSVDVDFNEAHDGVRLKVHLDEGMPLVVERIDFTGLDDMTPDVVTRLKGIAIEVGQPRDRQAVASARERITYVLRDSGFAHARVESKELDGSSLHHVVLAFNATPGPLTTFGDLSVAGLAKVEERVVRRAMAIRTGDLYRISKVNESQRKLNNLGIFDFAHVGNDPRAETVTSPLPMVATVTEGKPRRYKFSGGFGSDGPRGAVRVEHVNFLGDARQFAVEARYGTRLKGMGIDFTEPHFLTRKWSATASFGGWFRNETTYASRELGGRMGVQYRTESSRNPDVEPTTHVFRATYAHEALNYTIAPLTLADITQFEELIALGLDPVSGLGHGRLTAIELDFERIAVDHPADPHRGLAIALHGRHAAPWMFGTYRFDELIAESRVYVPAGERTVVAGRARVGSIFAKPLAGVPIGERYFLGGGSNLRGWGRYEIAPLTKEGLPIGGKALLELSTEVRYAFRESWLAVVFFDAGNVWRTPSEISLKHLWMDAGPGIRWLSPFGVVRADVGWQLNRIPNLRINGEPQVRRWRLHLSLGHSF